MDKVSDLVMGIDYRYVIPEKEDQRACIQLTSGEFKDTIYRYGDVKVSEDGDNGYLNFVFEIVESPFDKEVLEDSIDFKNAIGNVLISIIENNILKDANESATNDIEEPDL